MRRPSRRTAFLVALGGAAVLIAANVAGILRYPGGPVGEYGSGGIFWLDLNSAQPGTRVGYSTNAGLPPATPIYVGEFPLNRGSSSITIDQARLVDATPALHLVEARLLRANSSAGGLGVASGSGPQIEDLHLFTDYVGLPADLAGDAPTQDGSMVVEVLANEPGEYKFDAVAIDYRMGPFSFTALLRVGLTVCYVPMPSGTECSSDILPN